MSGVLSSTPTATASCRAMSYAPRAMAAPVALAVRVAPGLRMPAAVLAVPANRQTSRLNLRKARHTWIGLHCGTGWEETAGRRQAACGFFPASLGPTCFALNQTETSPPGSL